MTEILKLVYGTSQLNWKMKIQVIIKNQLYLRMKLQTPAMQYSPKKKKKRKKKRNQSSLDCRKRLLQLANSTTSIIKPPTIQIEYNIYQQKSSAHLMVYLHACMGVPVVKTYINNIKNNWLTTYLGLTVESIKRHLPKTIQTTMGHMHRVKQNLRSTQKVTSTMIMNETEEETGIKKTRQLINQQNQVSINTIQFEELNGMISTDQTGQFPITSGQGNRQIMVTNNVR